MSALLTLPKNQLLAHEGLLRKHYARCGRILRNIRKTKPDGEPVNWTRIGTMAGGQMTTVTARSEMDGKLIDWREANVHILTHCDALTASSVFEGERALTTARFPKAASLPSVALLVLLHPISMIPFHGRRDRGREIRGHEGQQPDRRLLFRAVPWRGAARYVRQFARNPDPAGHRRLGMAHLLRRREVQGAKLDILPSGSASPRDDPGSCQGRGLYMICPTSKHAARPKGCSDCAVHGNTAVYLAERTGANIFFVKDGGSAHAPWPIAFPSTAITVRP